MCSFLGVDMENYQGDLTDIVRGTAGSDVSAPPAWQFPSDPVNFSSSGMDDPSVVDSSFGDPFSAMSIDPLLDELAVAGSPGYFIAPAAPVVEDSFCPESSSNNVVSGSNNIRMLGTHKIFEDDSKSPPCNILSRIQISPSGKQMGVSPRDSPAMVSPRGVKAPAVVAGNMINGGSSEGCLIDGTGPVQISSPRNLGIKRRKNQAKKVVCIPAPAAANSRSSGEVVPSDLWAWRKYGQKPIKGSPYPRGYYRCSSSKGCSARKQVERSRTDPNMLVITYTSEHNHPWPTQRNALAGSTRSQPSKGNAAGKKDETPTKESSSDGADLSPTIAGGGTCASVKEEGADDTQNKEMELEDPELDFSGGGQGYRPELISADESGHQHQDDLFAGLDVIEADPLNLLFSGDDEPSARQKGLDPFSIFDWSGEIKRNLSP